MWTKFIFVSNDIRYVTFESNQTLHIIFQMGKDF